MSNKIKLIEVQDMNNLFFRMVSQTAANIKFQIKKEWDKQGKKYTKEEMEEELRNRWELRIHTKEENIEDIDIEKRINEFVSFFENIEKRIENKEKQKINEEMNKYPIEYHDSMKMVIKVIEGLISSRRDKGMVKEDGKIKMIPSEDQILTFDARSWRRNYLVNNQIEPLDFEGLFTKEEIEIIETEPDDYKAGRVRIDMVVLNIIKAIYKKEYPNRVKFEQGYEADDYHGQIVEEYMSKNQEEGEYKYNVSIITSDNDQNHLTNHNQPIKSNEYGKVVKRTPINAMIKKGKEFPETIGKQSLLQKIIEGDSSDNIASIIPSFILNGVDLKKGVMGEAGIQKQISVSMKNNDINFISTEEDFLKVKEEVLDFFCDKYRKKIITKIMDIEKEKKKEGLDNRSKKEIEEIVKKEIILDKINEQFDRNRYMIELFGTEEKINTWYKNLQGEKEVKKKDEKDLKMNSHQYDLNTLNMVSPMNVEGKDYEDFTLETPNITNEITPMLIKLDEQTFVYIKSIKTNKNILELYNAETGVLIKTSPKDGDKGIKEMKSWILNNKKSILDKINILKNQIGYEPPKPKEKKKKTQNEMSSKTL